VRSRDKLIRLAAIAGLTGPLCFAVVTILLTWVQSGFMRSLGWDPLLAPTFDWPSGLSLGPYGPLMTAAFLLSGAATIVFALGLRVALPEKIGPGLLGLAGLAAMGLAFSTDPTRRTTPATWHGRMHDLSFAALGLTLIPAMIFLGGAFRRNPKWRDLAPPTWVAAILSIPAFGFKGQAFYVFLLAVLAWFELVAWRLMPGRGD
jgi:hypothetical protein